MVHVAGLEKTKGNESFRIADNQDAVACYSKSLAYDPTSAVVWANRAMAYIRLELFDLAEADSSVALLLDPTYVKAYSRRGLVRFKRGKYAEVCDDNTAYCRGISAVERASHCSSPFLMNHRQCRTSATHSSLTLGARS